MLNGWLTTLIDNLNDQLTDFTQIGTPGPDFLPGPGAALFWRVPLLLSPIGHARHDTISTNFYCPLSVILNSILDFLSSWPQYFLDWSFSSHASLPLALIWANSSASGGFQLYRFKSLATWRLLVLSLGFLFFGKEGLNLQVVLGMVLAVLGMIWYGNASAKPGGKEGRSILPVRSEKHKGDSEEKVGAEK
jgi:hypothetical protein